MKKKKKKLMCLKGNIKCMINESDKDRLKKTNRIFMIAKLMRNKELESSYL